MKKAFIKLDSNGKPWVACPYCEKRIFPVSRSTKIENLVFRCKNSNCSQDFEVDIGNYKQKKSSDDDGQISLF